jgi:arylsulfatase A-like enzyme
MYDPADIPVGGTYMKLPPENASEFNRLKAEECERGRLSEAGRDWKDIYSHYLGNVTLIDRSVGMMLDALDECGLAENTIVVFTSDHGDMMGDHDLLGKCVMYEEAVCVPLLMRIPWLGFEQKLIRGNISQIDLVPTLLELINQNIPSRLEGHSRADVIRNHGTLEDNEIVIEWNGNDGEKFPHSTPEETVNRLSGQPWRSIVMDGWKLNLSPVDQCELYDLNHDPMEEENKFDDPACRQRVRDMAERLHCWQAATHDNAPLPEIA